MKKTILLALLVLLGVGFVNAQTRITGKVTNAEDGKPLPFVTVTVKGTTVSSTSGNDGSYIITAPEGSSILVFTFVGIGTEEVTIGGRSTIDVIMSGSTMLEETVVTAFGGVVKKSSVSGAITSVKGDLISKTPVPSFDQALAGKIAGVQVSTASGLIGDGTSIRIRGTNSVSMSSQPLVVIDGIPISEVTNVNIFNGGDGTRFNPMASISSNDIESIEILKDAAAAALYGSRAANGVMLITTKKGKEGRTSVSYNSTLSWAKAVKSPDLLNAQQFVDITNEKATNWNNGAPIEFAKMADLNSDGVMDETDWLDRTFRSSFTHNHQVSLSGGSDKSSFYGSVDWIDQEGITVGNNLERYSFRVNADAKATKWLKGGISLNYSRAKNLGVLSDSYLAGTTVAAYNAPPNVLELNSDGTYNLSPTGNLGQGPNLYSYAGQNTYGNAFYHPTAVLNLQRNANTVDRVLGNAYLEAALINGLRVTSKIGIDNLRNFEDQYSHPLIGGLGKGYNGLVQDNIGTIEQWNWQTYANYDLQLTDHTFSAMVGLEYQQRRDQNIYAGGSNFINSEFRHLLDGLYTEPMSGGDISQRGFMSYYGRLSYNYLEKYYIEASFRSDGYSGFGSDEKWGFFPGVSAAWRMGQEDFLKNVTWMSDLKLRASWGILGNSNLGPYASRTLYGGGQYAELNGFSMSRVGNPNLKWESSQKIDIGVDASFLNGRINATIDYFRTDVSDMLFSAPVLYTTGIPNPSNQNPYGSVTINVGEMWNQGFEIQINTTNFAKNDLRWTTTLNFTTVKNKIIKLAGDDILGTQSVMVDHPMGIYRLYEWAGVDPATGRAGYVDQNTGNIKYYDPNPAVPVAQRWKFADGSSATPLSNSDLVLQEGKTGAPKWYGNIDNTVSYKWFDLTLGLQFGGGNYIWNMTKQSMLTNNMNNNATDILDRWTTVGQQTDIPKLYWKDAQSLVNNSTLFLEKGDFLRVRDITLGYTLPSSFAKKIGVDIRAYARVSNLAVLTGYSGMDPEVNAVRNSNYQVGRDNRATPFPRTWTLGFNLTF